MPMYSLFNLCICNGIQNYFSRLCFMRKIKTCTYIINAFYNLDNVKEQSMNILSTE